MKKTKTMMLAVALAFSTTAMADDMKKPEPAKKAPDTAKKEEPKAPKMEAPKPAPEIAAAAKDMVGTWNCTSKMAAMGPMPAMEGKGTTKMTLDATLDKFYIKGEFSMTAGPMKVKGVEYITYDSAMKKWFRFAVDSTGGSEWGSSPDMKNWEGETRMMGMNMKTKGKVDATAKELKVSMESSMDGGKKWSTGAFEMTCKK
jgi:hypothetical protein